METTFTNMQCNVQHDFFGNMVTFDGYNGLLQKNPGTQCFIVEVGLITKRLTGTLMIICGTGDS